MAIWTFKSEFCTEVHSDTLTKAHAFRDFLCGVNQLTAEELGRVEILCGNKHSTLQEAWDAALSGIEAFETKRETTHKQITVHAGASSLPCTFKKVWVRK